MGFFLFSTGLFLTFSSLFHFLNPRLVNSKLTNIPNVRCIGVVSIGFGIWGLFIPSSLIKFLGFLFFISGIWRAFFPSSSIRFQTEAYPRWVHGLLMAIAAFCLLFAGLLSFNLGQNLWGMLVDRDYVIPRESSIFSFHVTKMNEGSGDWWLYGEDDENFFYFTGETQTPYSLIQKKDAAVCPSFKAQDHSTWPSCSF